MTSGKKIHPAASRTTRVRVRAKRPAKRFRSACMGRPENVPAFVVVEVGGARFST